MGQVLSQDYRSGFRVVGATLSPSSERGRRFQARSALVDEFDRQAEPTGELPREALAARRGFVHVRAIRSFCARRGVSSLRLVGRRPVVGGHRRSADHEQIGPDRKSVV